MLAALLISLLILMSQSGVGDHGYEAAIKLIK